jgi:glycosyltransferase involved in cell wall biosynthesis
VHSPREWEFLGWSLFIREHYTIFREKGIELVILTLIDYHRPSFAETLFLTQVYRFAFSALNKLPISVRIGTVSELLKLEYEKISGLQVEIFPDLAVGTMEVPVSVEDEFIDITYLGGARYTKGFDLLVDMIEHLKTRGALLDKMQFWIQANIQPGTKVKIVQKALEKLEILSKEHENIKIVKGPLSTEDYYALVARSDIVILPYRKEFYRNLVSGPFVEALSFSKVPIIPEGTWMAYEASKYGLKGITFHSGSITSLGDALIRVIADLYILKKDIEKISPLWRQYHNPDNFVRILLSKRG